uniref:Glycolipid transfer protein domain-containing protein n=1 Tax=Pelusios castaneus TaxID=367368 RepID=A0A8C8S3Y7_9SAUR
MLSHRAGGAASHIAPPTCGQGVWWGRGCVGGEVCGVGERETWGEHLLPQITGPLSAAVSQGRAGAGAGLWGRAVWLGRRAPAMGPGCAGMSPQQLLRFLVPMVAFFGLLILSSLRLQVQLSGCVRGRHPCSWFRAGGETPPTGGNGKPSQLSQTTNSRLLPPRPRTPPPFQDTHCPGKGFQVSRLLGAFRACITLDGEILLQEYLLGWKELIKLMDSLGAAFGLIAQETQAKMAIMERHQVGVHGSHYHTLQAMVAFELRRGLVGFQQLPPRQPPSGCRTLLRLHRALKWLELFLAKLGHSQPTGDPSELCAEAYQEALAPYHSWWVRQAAGLAFLSLPSRQELYRIMCAEEEREAQTVLAVTVSTISRVYNVTQRVYAAHGMLELP